MMIDYQYDRHGNFTNVIIPIELCNKILIKFDPGYGMGPENYSLYEKAQNYDFWSGLKSEYDTKKQT